MGKIYLKNIAELIILVLITVIFAYYVASLLFMDKNSYETYDSLKTKKVQLEYKIKQMQMHNAKLQKDYFELKNLEPEQ